MDKNRKSQRPRTSGLGAKKSLGQNFLVDGNVVEKIVEAFDPQTADVVLEIGPGHGALTERLIERVGSLFALEFDRDLAHRLRERFRDNENFFLVEDDALVTDFRALVDTPGQQLRLIANLPYNISTAILQRLFDHHGLFSNCILMFQREVVERITAEPGTKDRGFLTVMTEAYFSVERLFDVPPHAFRPAPKIWSSVVRMTPALEAPSNSRELRDLVSTGFAQKRKTILNNLKAKYPEAARILNDSGIDPGRRAETLSLGEWTTLTDALIASDLPKD